MHKSCPIFIEHLWASVHRDSKYSCDTFPVPSCSAQYGSTGNLATWAKHLNTIANHITICSLSLNIQRHIITLMHANRTYLKNQIMQGDKLNPVSSLLSIKSWVWAPFACGQHTRARVMKAVRGNTQEWSNISTVGWLQLVLYEWGLWLRSEESRSEPVPMLPYQYIPTYRENKEGRKEWMEFGLGTDTPNKTKIACVFVVLAVQFALIYINILMITLTPKA